MPRKRGDSKVWANQHGASYKPGKKAKAVKAAKALLPTLSPDSESIARFTEALAKAIERETVDPRIASELNATLRAAIANSKQRAVNREIDDLRVLVDDGLVVQAAALSREVALRQHRSRSDADALILPTLKRRVKEIEKSQKATK